MQKQYWVYLMTNPGNRVIYTGVTSNLIQRVFQHKNKMVEGFTAKYNVIKLVYFEAFDDVNEAIKREKQLKAGSRKRKPDLILANNPLWEDLYERIL